jgi:iron(III) transport system substrate-binding protein
MLVDLWGGGEEGWKKVSQLFRNLKVLNRSSLVFQGVGGGEYPLGISLEYAGPLWAAGGAPVQVIYPNDGTTASMEGVAIIKGGPNPDPAKAFVDYINRKDVREMILKATYRRPTRSDVDLDKLPGGMPPMSAVKLVKYDEAAGRKARQDPGADQGRPAGFAVKAARTNDRLILRSRAQRGVSKGGPQHDWFAPFETGSCGALLWMRPAA